MENQTPWQDYGNQPEQQPPFPTGKKELIYAALTLLCSMALCNFIVFAGIPV